MKLSQDAMGRWVLTTADGTAHTGVMAVRAFPIQSPEHGVSIMDAQGHELAWVDDLVALPEPTQSLLRQALQGREFMPEIVSIRSVSGFITPCTWFITTDRGDTELLLKGDEDIRRVAGNTLLITDSHGIHFLIRDLTQLSRESRKLLDRFM
jgi:hypothetical protein